MDTANDQLQTKYQKIATEYSKIRAQANVLKKAIIDEQARSSDLQEQLKEKEVEIRRAEQELDSLSFRNQQLTKRVTVLQEELDEVQNRGKKSRSKSSEKKSTTFPVAIPNHILDEEFQKKIVENAHLMSQMSNKDVEIMTLNEKIDQLEFKLEQYEKNKADYENKYEISMRNLEKERNDLHRKLQDKHNARALPSPERQDETRTQQNGDKNLSYLKLGKNSNNYESEKLGYGINQNQYRETKSSTSDAQSQSSHLDDDEKNVKQSYCYEETTNKTEVDRLFELEKELNFWKAEYNVMKIKFDQLQNIQDLHTSQLEKTSVAPVEVTNMLGRLRAPFAIPEEIEAREAKIKEYFMQRIDQLISEKHIYHIKNLAITADTEIMSMHLDLSESSKRTCEENLRELQASLESFQEDQEVQEGNYKAQLSTISEHLANMNDKLIQQTEEIQQLKFELEHKNARKGKPK